MADIVVSGNRLIFGDKTYRCAIGRSGFSADKKEGDGATPLGIFQLRECWYRADRIAAPTTKLPLRIIGENDGWCDDPKSPNYNKHVKLPYNFSHERLFRDDAVYDIIAPIGYNDDPAVSGKGSAIFLHLAHGDYRPTEGCIALAKPDFLAILRDIDTNTTLEIKE
jgi:L,D-peptidoglycan transpeptidase YkuD (ErfK/YbiS/YcfS/YnhG family)